MTIEKALGIINNTLFIGEPREDIEIAIETVTSALSENKGGWIPIEEREPNNYEEALVCTDTEEIFKATYYAWEGFDDDDGNAYSGEIIAWQPLPEPYKKGE